MTGAPWPNPAAILDVIDAMTNWITTHGVHPPAAEIKFAVPTNLIPAIRAWARVHLAADPYGTGSFGDQYDSATLYFDTDSLDVFHRRGSYGRAKYRVRRYGASDIVYLERKARTSGRVIKRRTPVPIGEYALLDDPAVTADWRGWWFRERVGIRRVAPVCRVAYRRTARVADGPSGPIRVTLDDRLHVSSAHTFFTPAAAVPLGADGILEIKYRVAPPAFVKQFVEDYGLTPASISKYRLAIAALDLALISETTPAHTEMLTGDTR